ncbi:hypothetical protein [Fictibacillus gelatini]|uniref:hypothetical protein n=1 Tax=Fictibacillus gelatini TaxID=225985 RepID=UPI00047EAF52|nr:hypothetical protein [Fictibacillus gelatini]
MQRFDLLFIKGTTLSSKIIRAVTSSPYSHVAIVLDSYHVVETDIRYPLQIRHISYPKRKVDVYRFYRDFTEKEKAAMKSFIMENLHTQYDIVRTVSNGLFIMAKIPIMNAVKRMNCTEAAYEMFLAAGIDLEVNDLTPKGLVNSKKLIKIMNLGDGA